MVVDNEDLDIQLQIAQDAEIRMLRVTSTLKLTSSGKWDEKRYDNKIVCIFALTFHTNDHHLNSNFVVFLIDYLFWKFY